MRLIAKVIRISRAKFHYNRLTTGACPTVERSIWTDPLVRAMWIGPPLDALERNTKKTKMADFHRPFVCQLIKRTLICLHRTKATYFILFTSAIVY